MNLTERKEHSLSFVYDPLGVKRLTRLTLQFSHLNAHKFRHGFGHTISSMCGCNADIEDTKHLASLFHVRRFNIKRNYKYKLHKFLCCNCNEHYWF